MLTETDELAHAIDKAAQLWPELRQNRTELLRRIVRAGSETIQRHEAERISRRRAAITQASGSLTGAWPSNWRDELRNDWPA